jgi:hypothetical protein
MRREDPMIGSQFHAENKAGEAERAPTEPRSNGVDPIGIARQDGAAKQSPAVLAQDLNTLPPPTWPSDPSGRRQARYWDDRRSTWYLADDSDGSGDVGPLGVW